MSRNSPAVSPVIGRIHAARYRRRPTEEKQRYVHRMLATRHRWDMVKLLYQNGAMTVGNIAKKIKVCPSYVSLQLHLLRTHSVLIRDRRGRNVYYTVNLEHDMLRASLRFMPEKRRKNSEKIPQLKVRTA